jgi:hypothetical protein
VYVIYNERLEWLDLTSRIRPDLLVLPHHTLFGVHSGEVAVPGADGADVAAERQLGLALYQPDCAPRCVRAQWQWYVMHARAHTTHTTHALM